MGRFHIRPLTFCTSAFFLLFLFVLVLPDFTVIILDFYFSSAPSPFPCFSSPVSSSGLLCSPILHLSSLPVCLPSRGGAGMSCGDEEVGHLGRERDEWGCMVKSNTHLNYSYRFRVVWDVVTFSLLVPLIHILWLNIL